MRGLSGGGGVGGLDVGGRVEGRLMVSLPGIDLVTVTEEPDDQAAAVQAAGHHHNPESPEEEPDCAVPAVRVEAACYDPGAPARQTAAVFVKYDAQHGRPPYLCLGQLFGSASWPTLQSWLTPDGGRLLTSDLFLGRPAASGVALSIGAERALPAKSISEI